MCKVASVFTIILLFSCVDSPSEHGALQLPILLFVLTIVVLLLSLPFPIRPSIYKKLARWVTCCICLPYLLLLCSACVKFFNISFFVNCLRNFSFHFLIQSVLFILFYILNLLRCCLLDSLCPSVVSHLCCFKFSLPLGRNCSATRGELILHSCLVTSFFLYIYLRSDLGTLFLVCTSKLFLKNQPEKKNLNQ